MTIFPIVTYSHYSAAHLNEKAKTRILVIDDEESIRYAVDAGLEFLGDFDVNFAEDGIKGIQLLKDFAPNLVLVDLVLPSASGMEVIEAIRKDPDIDRPDRVVLMTGHANPVGDSHFGDIGIDRVLSKPFKLEQLKEALFD
jgi:two-component system response regulator RpaA